MTLPANGTWCRTESGQHVYVENSGDGWYWSHDDQGWYFDPDLLLQVPPAPTGARLKSEYRRLRHGWPSFWKIFDVNNARMTRSYNVQTVIYLAALVWMWVYKIGLDYGIHNVARSWQQEIYGFYADSKPGGNYGAWWVEGTDTDQHARHIVFTLLFAIITLGILYSMYVGVAWEADPHKGALLLVPVVLLTIASIAKRNRATELAHHLHDVRRE